MPNISQLIKTPQLAGTGQRRVRITRNINPKYFNRDRSSGSSMGSLKKTLGQQVYDSPPTVYPSLGLFGGSGAAQGAFSQSPQGQIADQLADETAPIDFGLGGKALGAGIKGVAGIAAGASPSQIAGSIASSQLSPMAAAALANKFAGPAIGRQGIATAVSGVEDAFGLEGMDAVEAARQDPVSRDISIGPKGVEIGPGLTSKQARASQELDQSLVENRNLNRSLTSLGWQGIKSLMGYAQPVLSSTYDAPEAMMSKGGFSFEAVTDPDELEAIGVNEGVISGSPDAPVGKSKFGTEFEMTLDQYARMRPEMFRQMPGRFGGLQGRGELGPGEGGGPSDNDTPSDAVGSPEGPGIGGSEQSPTDQTARGGLTEEQVESVASSPMGMGRGMYGRGDKYLCTELYAQGMIPEEIYKADSDYSNTVNPILKQGYSVWAKPFAEYLSKKTKTGKVLAVIAKPFVLGWAQNMARRMGVKAKFSLLGAVVEWIGVPSCYILGGIKNAFDRCVQLET